MLENFVPTTTSLFEVFIAVAMILCESCKLEDGR